MPATEQYWRDQNLLNQLFAGSGVVLLGVTVWMFAADHSREWKDFQTTANDVERSMNRWKQLQVDVETNRARQTELANQLLALKSSGLSPTFVQKFKEEYVSYLQLAERSIDPATTFATLDAEVKQLDELAAAAAEKRKEHEKLLAEYRAADAAMIAASEKLKEAKEEDAKKAASADMAKADANLQEVRSKLETEERELNEAEKQAGPKREAVLARLNTFIRTVEFDESLALSKKKFAAAHFDATRAALGLMVRDNAPAKKQEAQKQKVDEAEADLNKITLKYQRIVAHRTTLAGMVKQETDKAAELQKNLDATTAEQERLKKSYNELSSTWIVDYFPYLGKKWLELPIIDAFNSPLKIDNQHLPKLLQENGSFKKVARYDRCTTCHQLIDRSLAGQPTTPAFVPAHDIVLKLEAPPRPTSAQLAATQDKPADLLRELYGIQIASGAPGTDTANDVVINYVARESRAALAQIAEDKQTTDVSTDEMPQADVPGVMVGDVLAKVGDNKVLDETLARRFLLETVKWGQPLEITVRRGLRNPYTSHPRLDLYMTSASPHPLQTFGCTICHEGQGNATTFKYASHSPNDKDEERRWKKEHGWFDNHHWIFPQYEERFLEATCLKCHHQVVELERSEKFLDPPAPKVTKGHELIRRYGCFGCHEINGFDGSKRIGPDMRLEPNFFAVAQQLTYLLNKPVEGSAVPAAKSGVIDEAQALASSVVAHPDDTKTRDRLRDLLEQQKAAKDGPSPLPPAAYDLIGLLRDPESAGSLRRTGPSLRFVGHKVDEAFLYDWIANPSHFRPTTLMPKFFGNWSHLDGEDLKKSQMFEPLEVLGIVKYLENRTQPFAYEQKPELAAGASWQESTPETKLERGKQAFAVRGCLACHNHQDFPAAAKLRGKETPQGPDLTGLGTKFDRERNPNGRPWLYSWVKNPSRYHVRTKMPITFLDPIPVPPPKPEGAAAAPAPGAPAAPLPAPTVFTDPADDIVEYLLSSKDASWHPPTAEDLAVDPSALNQLALTNLTGAYAEDKARAILKYPRDAKQQAEEDKKPDGLPESLRGAVKGIEVELIGPMSDEKKLLYIGRKAINKYGCFGCHDIPGFEDAKPIGTGLTDWGRKNPVMLAFGHIGEYFHGKKHDAHAAADTAGHPAAAGHAPTAAAPGHPPLDVETPVVQRTKGIIPATVDELDPFYETKVLSGSRIGFIGQKLNEPRSYDYKDLIKPYNDRLRMPKFPLNEEEREAVVTFVLGLVADPPHADYIYNPKPRKKAELEGRVVLEKYNCGGCHILEMDRWQASYKPGDIPPQTLPTNYPFLFEDPPKGDPSIKPDQQGRVRGMVAAAQVLAADDARASMLSLDGNPISTVNQQKARERDKDVLEETGPPQSWSYPLQLYQRQVLYEYAKDAEGKIRKSADGTPIMVAQVFEPGDITVPLPVGDMARHYPSVGGFLVHLNAPRALQLEKANNPTTKMVGKDTWSWLPPPLYDEGRKVEFEWLHNFLLDPYPIRPAVILRMPKFNMSADEATALVNYFAARDAAEYPYVYDPRTRQAPLDASNARFLAEAKAAGKEPKGNRLDNAMRVVAGICSQCHRIGDFTPDGDLIAQAPNLADAHRRLQRDYMRRWIADPKRILPYTNMPVNFPYKPDQPLQGGETLQDLYHGTSIDQIDAVVDLLVNFDLYAKQQTSVRGLVDKVKAERAAAMPPAPEGAAPPGAAAPGAAKP